MTTANTKQDNPSLFELAQQAEKAKDTEPKDETKETPESPQEEAADVEEESVASETSEADATDGGEEQGGSEKKGSKEASVAHQFLSLLGYDVDGVDDEDLIAEAKRRFAIEQKRPKPNVEPAVDVRAASAQGKEAPEKPEAKDPKETEKQAESRRIARLYCDPRLESLVEYNSQGRAIAKEGTGDDGVQAAKSINDYTRSYRERIQKFGEDPIGFLEEGGLQDLIQKEIQAGIDKFKQEQESYSKDSMLEQQKLAEEVACVQFFENNAKQLYVVGKDNKPRFVGGNRQLSPLGKAVEEEYLTLKELAPNAPDSQLLKAAMSRAEKYTAKPTDEAATEQQPEKTVKQRSQEKKRKFLDKRTAPPRQESSASPATVNEQAGKTRLRDLVLADPANDDNPAVLTLRGSAR